MNRSREPWRDKTGGFITRQREYFGIKIKHRSPRVTKNHPPKFDSEQFKQLKRDTQIDMTSPQNDLNCIYPKTHEKLSTISSSAEYFGSNFRHLIPQWPKHASTHSTSKLLLKTMNSSSTIYEARTHYLRCSIEEGIQFQYAVLLTNAKVF